MDGKIYTGEFVNDKFSGLGKLTMNNGFVYEGNFLDDLKDG
jgi:hypothetical protein